VTRRNPSGRKRRSLVAATYLAISAAASLLFYVAARATGSTTTDTLLGVVWVLVLSVIVSASLLPPVLERWHARRTRAEA